MGRKHTVDVAKVVAPGETIQLQALESFAGLVQYAEKEYAVAVEDAVV